MHTGQENASIWPLFVFVASGHTWSCCRGRCPPSFEVGRLQFSRLSAAGLPMHSASRLSLTAPFLARAPTRPRCHYRVARDAVWRGHASPARPAQLLLPWLARCVRRPSSCMLYIRRVRSEHCPSNAPSPASARKPVRVSGATSLLPAMNIDLPVHCRFGAEHNLPLFAMQRGANDGNRTPSSPGSDAVASSFSGSRWEDVGPKSLPLCPRASARAASAPAGMHLLPLFGTPLQSELGVAGRRSLAGGSSTQPPLCLCLQRGPPP